MAEAAVVVEPKVEPQVPLYAGLGSACRDLLEKGYVYGVIKLDAHRKTTTGFDLNGGATFYHNNDKFGAYLGAKYPIDKMMFSLTGNAGNIGKDYTLEDNTVTAEASAHDQLLKISADTTVNPKTGQLGGHLKSEFRDELTSCNLYAQLQEKGPLVIDGAAVVQHRGVHAGYRMCFDTDNHLLKENNFAFQYKYENCTLHACANNEKDFMASIHVKPNDFFEGAAHVKWTRDDDDTCATLAAKFDLDTATSIKAKINNLFGLGVAIRQKCSHGLTLSFAALLDLQNYNQGGNHKFGAGIELEL